MNGPRAAAAVLGAAALLLGAALPAAAANPLQPMTVYGTATVQGGAPVGRGSVQAWLDGSAAGAPMALSADGAFGSLGYSYLLIPGTASDAGHPLSFTVNGAAAGASVVSCAQGATDPGPGVTWQSGIVCQVALTVPASAASGGLAVGAGPPAAQVGQAYSAQLTVTGGTAPYTWSLDPNQGGSLPAGLSLSATGLLSGTPAAAGPAAFTVDVADGGHPQLTASATLGLLVVPAGVAIAATSSGSTTSDGAGATAGGDGSGTPETTATGQGGTGTVLTAHYAADPETSAPAAAKGTVAYFDVGVAPQSSFQTLTLQRCAAGAGAALYWWDASSAAWEAVSPQSYAAGCITAQLNDTTSSPLLSQLSGTPFAVSESLTSTASGGAGGAGGGGAGGAPVAQPPVVGGVSPDSGPAGTVVTVTGSGFTGVTTVWFGAALAQYTPVSDTRLTATAPAGSGTADVVVVTAAGRSATGTADRFTYGAAGALAPTAPARPQASFSEVPPTFWAAADIRTLVGRGIVGGFPDGTFRPDAAVTRAQFVKMLALTLGLTPGRPGAPTGFGDVPASAWYAPYVAAAVKAGVVDGTSPSTFSPDAAVTREQMAVLLARALKLTRAAPLAFKDAARIDAWARGGVAAAVAAGLVDGFPDGSFQPLATATRAQAAKVLAVVLERKGSAAAAPATPPA